MQKNLTRSIQKPGIFAMVIILLVVSLALRTKTKGLSPQLQEYKISKTISAAQLQKALSMAGGEEIPVFIYVVKASANNSNHDLQILLLSADANAKPIPVGNRWTESQLAKESAWYINFLKYHKIPADQVILGYQLSINKKVLEGEGDLEISIFPFDSKKSSIYWKKPGLHTHKPATSSTPIDSCKVPPGGCLAIGMPYIGTIDTIMKKKYFNGPAAIQ